MLFIIFVQCVYDLSNLEHSSTQIIRVYKYVHCMYIVCNLLNFRVFFLLEIYFVSITFSVRSDKTSSSVRIRHFPFYDHITSEEVKPIFALSQFEGFIYEMKYDHKQTESSADTTRIKDNRII